MTADGRDIAIIGAGMAGLSAGQSLRAAGHRVQVFDKSRSSGGRLCTRRGEGWQADHGAQYFTAQDPLFDAEVQSWVSAGAAALWSPNLVTLGGDGGHQLDPAMRRYIGTPRMGAAVRLVGEGLPLQTQTTITSLHREGHRWQLGSAEQGLLSAHFDTVVLALPAAQAAGLLATTNAPLAALARGVTMRGCWSLMLRFALRVDVDFDAAFVNDGPLGWIARDSSKPGRGGRETWVAQATPQWSQHHIEATPDQVLAMLLPAFAGWTGALPLESSAHRWRYADCQQPAVVGSVWSASQQLGLCGDWLNGGRVEGAWLSGRHLASQLLASAAPATADPR